MLAGNGGNFKAHHIGHLRGPQTGCVDYIFAGNVALVGVYQPFAGGSAVDAGHLGVGIDFRTVPFGPDAHGHGDAIGVHVAVVGPVQAADDTVGVHERMHRFHLFRGDPVHVKPQAAVHAVYVSQLFHAARIVGRADGAGGVPADALTGFGFQALVDLDALHVDLSAVVVSVEK